MKKVIAVPVVLLLVGIIAGLMWGRSNVPTPFGANVDTVFINTDFTAANTSVSSTRQKILSIKSGREVATICVDPENAVAAFPVYLHFTTASSTVATSTGYPIEGTGLGSPCFTIGDTFKFPLEVWGISNTSTVQTVVTSEN